ncbi:hypothetical protein PS15m_003523 [Mucor circinelloides]
MNEQGCVQEDVSGAIRWLIYIFLVQLRSCCSVVAYGIAFLEMSFNPDECSSTKSTLKKNILSIVRTLTSV